MKSGSGQEATRQLGRAFRVTVAVVLLGPIAPSIGAGQECNAFVGTGMSHVENPNTVGSVDTLRIHLTAGSITGGALNEVTVVQVLHDLDCVASSLPLCDDDGDVMSYMGDSTITSDCLAPDGVTPITWTTGHEVGTTPNRVVFTASPSLVMSANDSVGCDIEFQVRKESGSNDATPGLIEIASGYALAYCDNGLYTHGLNTTALPFATVTPTHTSTATPTSTPTGTPTYTPSVTPTATGVALSGRIIYYRDDRAVPGATVELSGSIPDMGTTNGVGEFGFADVPQDTCQIEPEKQADFRNGVSALDAAYVLQAVVEKRTLDDYQALACDVTGNGTVSSLDAARILQFMVEKIDRFPVAETCGSDWAFVAVPATVPDQSVIPPVMSSGTCQPGAIAYDPLSDSSTNQDFMAVLFGDCTGNWAPP